MSENITTPVPVPDELRCGGCGRIFTARGLRAHQSARFVAMGCRR